MNWLKDKKNLPIVAGVFSVILVGALVFILFQMGVIGGSSAPSTVVTAPPPGTPGMAPGGSAPSGGSAPPGAPGMPPPGMSPPGMPPRPRGGPAAPHGGAPAAAVAAADPTIINPHIGPDPFGIPGGAKKLDALKKAANPGGLSMPLSALLPSVHLTNYEPPQAAAPPPALNGPITLDASSPTMRVSGIVNAADGVYAILEVAGQSQTVKAGDPIPGGGQVVTIQPDGVTVRNGAGQTVVVPLSSGSAGLSQPPAPTDTTTVDASPMDQQVPAQ